MIDEAERVADVASGVLSLTNASLGNEYYYSSLTLCVIDAVYSIGVRYEGVQAVVSRYCDHYGVPTSRTDRSRLPARERQDALSDLVGRTQALGPERMAVEVYANRQRTSTRAGILKSEAVLRFASTLIAHGIQHLQDVEDRLPSDALEQGIREIPGQGSGISLQYFWMLAGSDDLIKPDRMILRFLEKALLRPVKIHEAQTLLRKAVSALRPRYPSLTPRLLDFKIWEYQRG